MSKKERNNCIAFVVTLIVSLLVFFGIINVVDYLEKENKRKQKESRLNRAAQKSLDEDLIDLDLEDL